MRPDGDFHVADRNLEERMRALAEADGDVFLPNPEPLGPAHFVLICMEPSLGWWARTAGHAKARVEAGFRNFLFSIEDFILHFCVRRYLCEPEQRYHITDISKGAMLVHRAGFARSQRYDRWYGLLLEEIELCATADAGIIAVGNAVSRHLVKRGFRRPFARVIHYSGQAAPARRAGIIGLEDRFENFRGSVCLEDVLAAAEAVFNEARSPSEIRNETLLRLAKSQLSISRQQLMFNYKIAFESMRIARSDLTRSETEDI